MKKFLPNGFTLIELMVVITIIAILSMIGIVSYSTVQKNARDARRKGDIDAIANALETNKTQNSSTYKVLTTNMFTQGSNASAIIPADSTTAQYCIAWSITPGAAPPDNPTAWATTVACPTAPATPWAATPSTAGTITTDSPPATATSWTACARLEISTADSGTGLQVYCRQSTQ